MNEQRKAVAPAGSAIGETPFGPAQGGATGAQPGVPRPERSLSVLILSPDPRGQGGVVTFVEVLKAHLRDSRVTPLWVGSVQGRREGPLGVVRRLFAAPLRTIRLVRRHNFDVVHLNPSLDVKALIRDSLILLALRMFRYPRVLICFHGWNQQMEQRIERHAVLRRGLGWLVGGAARIVVLSPDFRAALIRWGVGGDRIVVGRTMFDGRTLPRNDATPEAPRRAILFLSRFVRAKGIYELLDAFARIAPDFPDADLVMAGDGPDGPALRDRARALGLEERVRFPGFVAGPEKARCLRECTLFALPSYGEAMPIALLEAMAAGKVVLVSRVGVIPQILSDPENGVLLDGVSVDSVEMGLRRLLQDPAYCAAAGRRNADYAWERFEAGPVSAEFEALYRAIAPAAPASA